MSSTTKIPTLFGTDGIRGVAGEFPLKQELVRQLGFCAGKVLREKFPNEKIRVVGVRDTRESGLELFDALSEGLQSTGIDVYDAGVLATPSIAYLVHAHRCHSGFVISASHNPPEFNGIKFFNFHGRKWPDEWEREVESCFVNKKWLKSPTQGHRVFADRWSSDYVDFLLNTLPENKRSLNLRLAIDCSNGANSQVAPALFRKLGAEVFVIGTMPNGRNINVNCGSQSLSSLQSLVKSKRCDLGIAFDGDGDRVIFVDEKGQIVDGDHTLAILARWFKKNKRLSKNTVVITIMANLGLKKTLSNWGIKIVETPVGDRHVSEAMRLQGSVLGGEQSGHIILGQYLPSGDGLLTALHMASLLEESKKNLSSLAAAMKKFPQVLVNVHVEEKTPIHKISEAHDLIESVSKKLGDQGRVLVRYSGTEPLLRIMIEGPDKPTIQNQADAIAKAVLNNQN